MSNHKVKGFLKGLRYIAQIFENEKEPEMQIGNPTDVKHVAHIGWDGPSVTSPSWMTEYKPPSAFASAPLTLNGDINNKEPDSAIKWVSEDSGRRGSRSASSQGREKERETKSSRRQSTGSVIDSPIKEKSDKPRQSRKSSKPKDSSDGSRPARIPLPTDSLQGSESPARSLPDIPKKPRKKPKDVSNGGVGGSSKSRLKAQSSDPNPDLGSPCGSIPTSRKEQRPFEQYGQSEKGSSEIS